MVTEEQKSKASKTLGTMLDYLSLDAGIKSSEKGDRIALSVTSEDAGRIIGRKGQTLENIQLLLNRMMQKVDNDFPRVLVDIDGYSRKSPGDRRGGGRRGDKRRDGDSRGDEKRENELRQQAIDAAKEVKRWGESVTLPPMNGHERRIVHISLRDDAEISTESEGQGSKKKIVVSLVS